ncbi:unnamed protein product [Rotaria sordida]|uniref:Elongation factor 1-alpha n=2 Tax=Rotaria sordida TaxID=392033 RepID=A0A814E029_9BILA|nr:unnamed protein product [Rotaria sordida]
MIKNIVRADCVVLMVSACIDEFENSISENGQTRQQILFAYMLGAKQMIIAVNKMDADTVSYSENRFNQIQIELSTYLKQIGYPFENVVFVPISAWNGDNLVTVSNKMAWFTGWIIERQEGKVICKTFLEAIDTIVVQRQQFIDKPLRLPLQNVYKVRGIGTVAMGRVETGVLKTNMIVSFPPLNLTATVRSIEMCYETLTEAFPDTIVAFNIKNINAKELRHGLVCSDIQNDPARETTTFIAQIFMLNHSSQIEQGDHLIVDCHTARFACLLIELIDKIDHQISETIQVYPQSIKSGDLATVKMIPLEPVCVEKFDDYPSLGYFIVRDKNKIMAIGIIKDVEKV